MKKLELLLIALLVSSPAAYAMDFAAYQAAAGGVDIAARVAAMQAKRKAAEQQKLNGLQKALSNVSDMLERAKDGQRQIHDMPLEVAGLSILLIPGHSDFTSNDSGKQAIYEFTVDRKQYWEEQLSAFQAAENDADRRLDPADTGMVPDEAGVMELVSIPRQIAGAYESQNISRAKDLEAEMKVLQVKRRAIATAIGAVVAILKDNALDQAYIQSADRSESAQALINRKVALLKNVIIPDLTAIQTDLSKTLIPYAQSRLAN